jgi:hypothetical protein
VLWSDWLNYHLHNLRKQGFWTNFSAIITKDLFPLIVPAITASSAFFIQWNGFTRNHRFVDSGFPSVIFRQQEFFHLALREANHPFDIMNRNNFIASFMKVATVGANFNNSLWHHWFCCALASNNWPNKTKVSITVVASKYRCTVPPSVLNSFGKYSGKNKPNRLGNSEPIPIRGKHI